MLACKAATHDEQKERKRRGQGKKNNFSKSKAIRASKIKEKAGNTDRVKKQEFEIG
jgi:hypothetical protein